MRCQCIVVRHRIRCIRDATKRCKVCGTQLCGGCAKNCHVHVDQFESIVPPPTPNKETL